MNNMFFQMITISSVYQRCFIKVVELLLDNFPRENQNVVHVLSGRNFDVTYKGDILKLILMVLVANQFDLMLVN